MALISLSLPPNPTAISIFNQKFDELARSHQLSSPLKNAVKLSLNEAITNIFSYGFTSRDNPKIDLEMSMTELSLSAVLKDNGTPFDPTNHPSPQKITSLEEAQIGGFGIQLMREHSSKMTYQYLQSHNILSLSWLLNEWD